MKEDVYNILKGGIKDNCLTTVLNVLKIDDNLSKDQIKEGLTMCFEYGVEDKIKEEIFKCIKEQDTKSNTEENKLEVTDIKLNMSDLIINVGKNSTLMCLIHHDPKEALNRLRSEDISAEELNYQNEGGWTILHYLCRNIGKKYALEIVITILMNKNVDVNLQNTQEETALYLAIKFGDYPHDVVIDILLKHPKIDVNLPNFLGNTPLIMAVQKKTQKLDTILDHPDIDVNRQNKKGKTALVFSTYNKNNLKKLLEHPKIDVNLVDDKKGTILDNYMDYVLINCGKWKEKIEILKFLVNDDRIDVNGESMEKAIKVFQYNLDKLIDILDIYFSREDLMIDYEKIMEYFPSKLILRYFTVQEKKIV